VVWTREEFNWGLIEPEQGKYKWGFYDTMVEVAEQHGLRVYGLLCYWSPWAEANTDRGIEQYCGWVRQVVRRYKGRIRHWEIWNEPNIFFWTGPREMYAELLTRAYETIKQEDPQAVVLGCSTSQIDTGFIRMTMEQGGRFDALTIHPYRGVLVDRDYMDDLRRAAALVDGRPVWITEIGFPSQWLTGYSERRQASLVARVYLASLASGAVRNVSWYDFRNDGSDPYYNEMNFGLLRSDLRPKPGYRAMATIARAMPPGGEVAGEIEVGEGAYAFRFTGEERDTVAVCAPGQGRVLSFETDAQVRVMNAMGELVVPVREGDRHHVTLETGMPVYVEGRVGSAFRPVEPAARIDADRTRARAGDVIELQVSPAEAEVKWEMPAGWAEPGSAGKGRYRLAVPAAAAEGHHDLWAWVTWGEGERLRLPMLLWIQPATIGL
jgi:hypothetical protein